MKATFELTEEKIAEIRAAAETQPKVEPLFQVLVKDEEGKVVAEVDKLLYIKKKEKITLPGSTRMNADNLDLLQINPLISAQIHRKLLLFAS